MVYNSPMKSRIKFVLLAVALTGLVLFVAIRHHEKVAWRLRLAWHKGIVGDVPLNWSEVATRVMLPDALSDRVLIPLAATPTGILEPAIDGAFFNTPMGGFWAKTSEREVVADLVSELRYAEAYANDIVTVEPGDVVVDVGAHIGIFTRQALDLGAKKVIAIEADPANVTYFKLNHEQGLQLGNVMLVSAAALAEPRVARFTRLKTTVMTREAIDGEFTVLGTTIDAVVEKANLSRCDFIKLDIEGGEAAALRGAVATITRFNPDLAVASYHRPTDATEIIGLMQSISPNYNVNKRNGILLFTTGKAAHHK